MHSYMATNLLLLKYHRKGNDLDDVFPANLTLTDYVYFLAGTWQASGSRLPGLS